MAPMITGTKKEKDLYKFNKKLKIEKDNLIKLREYIESNFEYVGEKFSKKVREIYYDDKIWRKKYKIEI